MDTKNLEGEVLVWHCPDFLGYGDHEYLAYGCIRGVDYRAVSFHDLETHSILKLFPELQDPSHIDSMFGRLLRKATFRRPAVPPTTETLALAETLAKKYESLFLTVYLALLCLEPRPRVRFH